MGCVEQETWEWEMKDLTPDSLEQMLTYLRTVVDDKGERINIKPTHYYTKENMKEINEAFDREYKKHIKDIDEKNFVKLKMPTYYIAKHSDEDLRAAVLKEREACAKLCEQIIKESQIDYKESEFEKQQRLLCLKMIKIPMMNAAAAIRGRTE
jgi:hypothetical protein